MVDVPAAPMSIVTAAVLTAIAAVLMFGAHVGLITTVAIMAVLGIAARLAAFSSGA